MSETAQMLSHLPNSGIVHLPGRRFPGIVLQGDTLSGMYDSALELLEQARIGRDEENYCGILDFAERIHDQLVHYEEILTKQGLPLPYVKSVAERPVCDGFDQDA